MRLNLRALTLAAAVIGGLAILFTGIANMLGSGYGAGFLGLLSTLYPGYEASGTLVDLLVGTLYALADGAVVGLLFGFLYNRFLGQGSVEKAPTSGAESA